MDLYFRFFLSKLTQFVNLARRARQFYKGPAATLCDICEGDDCGDDCTIRASEQKADVRETDDGKGGQSSTFSSLSFYSIIVAVVLAKLF
jgi:CD109 antigen